MRKSMKKYLAAVVAMSALLQLTAYAGPGFSASSSREAAAAANAQYEAAYGAQNSTSVGASIDMSSINQGTVSPAEAMAIGQKLATVNGMSVTYQLPNNQTEVLDGLTIASWVNGSQGLTVSVDAAKVADYVQGPEINMIPRPVHRPGRVRTARRSPSRPTMAGTSIRRRKPKP